MTFPCAGTQRCLRHKQHNDLKLGLGEQLKIFNAHWFHWLQHESTQDTVDKPGPQSQTVVLYHFRLFPYLDIAYCYSLQQ